MNRKQWNGTAWIDMPEVNADRPVYWAITVGDPDKGGKVYATRLSDKCTNHDDACRSVYGIRMTPNMIAYNMTANRTEMRKLMHKLPG